MGNTASELARNSTIHKWTRTDSKRVVIYPLCWLPHYPFPWAGDAKQILESGHDCELHASKFVSTQVHRLFHLTPALK